MFHATFQLTWNPQRHPVCLFSPISASTLLTGSAATSSSVIHRGDHMQRLPYAYTDGSYLKTEPQELSWGLFIINWRTWKETKRLTCGNQKKHFLLKQEKSTTLEHFSWIRIRLFVDILINSENLLFQQSVGHTMSLWQPGVGSVGICTWLYVEMSGGERRYHLVTQL